MQKGLALSMKAKRALISYILMELHSPMKRRNNKLLQVFSKSIYQTLKDGSIVGVGVEGGCGKFDKGDFDFEDETRGYTDDTPSSSQRITRPGKGLSSAPRENTPSSTGNPELASKFSTQRRSSDGAHEIALEMREDRQEWILLQELADEPRERNLAEKEKRRDDRVKMICESVSIQEGTGSVSKLTAAEKRILEVDALSRSLRVKMTELTANIREVRQNDEDKEILEILEADLKKTKEQYRTLLGISSTGMTTGTTGTTTGGPSSMLNAEDEQLNDLV